MAVRVRIRLFAVQRELAGTREVAVELADGATVDDAWLALVERHPVLAPGRPSVRFARNGAYADADTPLADGDEVAMIPPVSGGSGTRILELREGALDAGILVELSGRLADPGDGAVVGFLGRTRETPGTPAPGQEAEAARHAGRSVESLEYEAHETMALATLAAIADEIEARFGVTGVAIVHRTGEVPVGEVSIAVDGGLPASRGRLRGRPLRDRRDEGPGAHLEGGAVRRRARLDRSPGTDRTHGGGCMRVYISVDMEGIGGISHPHPTDPANARYPASVELMVAETNAAIEGALAAGATDVLVNDSHWNMYNLLPSALHPAARVLQGEKAWSMVAGGQPAPDGSPSFDVALFVGYHARAGHPTGTIAHTYTGRPVETRLDGRPTGEYGFNALVLGAWGIPVGMVTGDDALAEEVEGWLPWAERVVVKVADGGHSATSVHPSVACDRVRAGAERAVRRAAAGELQVLRVDPPVVIEIDYPKGVIADFAALVPGGERVGALGVRYTSDDPVTAFRGFLTGNRVAGTVD